MTREGTRRLAAVWFADVVGYTALSARDEDLALRVVRELQRLARLQCDAQGGRVVKALGDAVLAVFDSADGAVRAAVGVRDAFLQSPEAKAAGVSLRVGLHLGDVTEAVDGDVYGDAVNGASRIEGIAKPGQVVISGIAYQLLQQRTALQVEDLGEEDLKGLGPVRLYAASISGEPESTDLRELLQAELAPLQLLDAAGLGGMGEIYLARDPRLRRTLAVKVLRSELVADKQARARFTREAQVIAGLSHPNVIGIHTVGELKDGTPYFVMDYVEGGSLADRLARDGPVSVPEARRILGEVAAALQAAHAKGIIHRDIKPGNVLWDAETGRALVTDWGIVALDKTFDLGPEERLTSTGMFIGSPEYMSPEQLAGDEVGPEVDIYAWGLLAFELLAGRGPFSAETPRGVMIAHLREDPPKLSTLRDDVDPELDELVLRALSKVARERPTAASLARRFAPGAGIVLEWPPPGTEGMRRAVDRLLGQLGLGVGFVLVSTYLAFAAASQSWADSEVLAGIAAAVWLLAIGTFLAALWTLRAVVTRALSAHRLGYGWGTVTDVAADVRGDAGLLIAGQREYASLSDAERRAFQSARRLALLIHILTPVIAVPSILFVTGLLTLGTASAELGRVVALVPWLACYAAMAFLRLREWTRLRSARQGLRARPAAVRHIGDLVEPWRETLRLAGGEHQAPAGPFGPVWLAPASAAGLGLGLVAVLIVTLPVVYGGLWGAINLSAAAMRSYWSPRVEERYTHVMIARPFRLLADSSLSEEDAGSILWGILTSVTDVPPGTTPPGEAYALPPWDPPDVFRSDNPLPPYQLVSDSIIRMGARFTADQRAWIQAHTAHPVFAAFSRLARASSADIMGAMYRGGIPDSLTHEGVPIPRLGRIREIAYWKRYRAAALVGQGRAADAEREMLETISVGLFLAEEPLLITALIGNVLVQNGQEGLVQVYEETGRTAEARAIRAQVALLDSVIAGQSGVPGSSGGFYRAAEGELAALDVITFSRRLPSQRWRLLVGLSTTAPCAGPARVLFGAGRDYEIAVEAVRRDLARRPGDLVVLRLIEEALPRNARWVPESGWRLALYRAAQISAMLLANDRILGCTAIALRSQLE